MAKTPAKTNRAASRAVVCAPTRESSVEAPKARK